MDYFKSSQIILSLMLLALLDSPYLNNVSDENSVTITDKDDGQNYGSENKTKFKSKNLYTSQNHATSLSKKAGGSFIDRPVKLSPPESSATLLSPPSVL